MIMVSFRSRPIWDRSYPLIRLNFRTLSEPSSYLHIIALMIVTAFTEKPMVYNTVDVKLIQEGVAILVSVSAIQYPFRSKPYL